MCEFKVYIEENGKERMEVARNIIMVKKKEGIILLVNDVGEVTMVNNANIEEANTFTQEMILRRGD
ncbi:MAG: CooT family nickel-binding protein [Methanotrichaceae archaeon]